MSVTETELEKKIKAIANSFQEEKRLFALTPKFERALLNSPFAFYGIMRQITELQDENSAYSQFIRKFLQENGFDN